MKLKDKLVLITGGASGIGLEIALHCARRGARIVLVDISQPALDQACQQLEAQGATCLTEVADVASEPTMRQLAETLQTHIGVIDVLVNNAGVAYLGAFVDTPIDVWRRLLDINVMGVVHGCVAFLPQMLAAGGPRRIVNVASAAGIGPNFNLSAYVASKHAVVGLTETLNLECRGSNVGVTLVCPGVINTSIVEHQGPRHVAPNIPPGQLERLQAFYRAQGCHPSVVAADVVNAIEAGNDFVLTGPFARTIYHLRRLSRRLLLGISHLNARKTGYA